MSLREKLNDVAKGVVGFAKTEAKRRLTVAQERVLTIAGAMPRRCGTCSRWSEEAGQHILRNDPTVAMLTSALTPAQWSAAQKRQLKYDPADAQLDAGSETDERLETWLHYGACARYKELVHADRRNGAGDADKDKTPCPGWQ